MPARSVGFGERGVRQFFSQYIQPGNESPRSACGGMKLVRVAERLGGKRLVKSSELFLESATLRLIGGFVSLGEMPQTERDERGGPLR